MDPLSPRQRKALRGLAHALDPVVHLGHDGLTDAVVSEVDRSLSAHELIKVRLSGERSDRTAQARALAERANAHLVTTIGRMAVFYRPSEEADKKHIRLPPA